MKQYDDIEFITDSEEEIQEREREEEIKRIVRDEYRRVNSGEADDDIAEDIRQEQLRKEQEEQTYKTRPKWLVTLQLFLTGEILVKDEVAKFYSYGSYIAMMFFVSIVTLFAALRMDMRYNHLKTETELLHEKAIRIREQRYHKCSHSAIVEQLEKKGIGLYDPDSPPTVIKR